MKAESTTLKRIKLDKRLTHLRNAISLKGMKQVWVSNQLGFKNPSYFSMILGGVRKPANLDEILSKAEKIILK